MFYLTILVVRGLTQGGPGLVTIPFPVFLDLDGTRAPRTGGQVHRGTRFHDTPGCQTLFDKFGKVFLGHKDMSANWETSLPGSEFSFSMSPGVGEGSYD